MGQLTSFVQTALTGGEISQSAQGRMDLPSYKISMNVCLNGIPVETGAWQRRPGTRHVAPTRSGKTGKLISFAFEDNFPYVMEFTDGFLRFTTGPALVMTNDQQAVSALLQSTGTYAIASSTGGHLIGAAGLGASGGFQFTAPATGAIQQINIDIVAGGGSGTWKAQLWSNSGGHPGAQIGSDSSSVAGIGITAVKGQAFSFVSQPSVTAGTPYWIVLVPVVEAQLVVDTCATQTGYGSGRSDTITAIGTADLPSSDSWRMEVVYGAVSASLNPTHAVVQTAKPHGWSSGNSVALNALGVNNPLLQNRQFMITVIDATHLSIADAVTGTAIDGSTLGSFVSGNVTRILEIATNYTTGSWSTLRSVQAETRSLLLNGTGPQVLQVATPPTQSQFATFTYGPADFIDGPYLDPIVNSNVTSSALNGVVTLTFSFAAWSSTVAYNVGDFVTSLGICYKSMTALNQNHTPASSPTNWAVVTGGAAVNQGQGFVKSDIGRLLRLFSEPPAWTNSTYSAGNIVSYPAGNGANSYWIATGTISAGTVPGTSTLWAVDPTGAQWTWAQITSVSGSGLIAPATAIGNLTGGGGLSAAFDGNPVKSFSACAALAPSILTYPVWSPVGWAAGSFCQYAGIGYVSNALIFPTSPYPNWVSGVVYSPGAVEQYGGIIYECFQSNVNVPPNTNTSIWVPFAFISIVPPPSSGLWSSVIAMPQPTEDCYVGQTYGSAQTIQSAVIFPSTDNSYVNNPNSGGLPIVINLRASNTLPATPSSGTLLGTSGAIPNIGAPVTINSNDLVSTWTHVWFEIVSTFLQPLPDDGSHAFKALISIAQAEFFSPNIANGSVITAQVRGPAMPYSAPINTWQLGVYSDTTGWPTCGAYYQGRIWLGGVISNRFDACVSNGFTGTEIDFTPTGPDGTVSDNNSISYICDGEDSNQILWMMPDQQGVLFGTQAGEWLISAPSQGAITPTNISAARITKIGCANAEPRRAEHTLLFIQKFSRKIMEYFADVFSGKFSAPNLSDRAKHLTVNGIAEMAYQQELAPTLWCRRSDGALIGATYKRDTLTTSQGPNIIGWHRHQLGSGRAIESICVGPSVGGNLENLSMITNDLSTGIRHIELMSDLLDEGFQLSNCWFLDDGIAPSSTAIQAATTPAPFGSLLVNGLSVHNGKTVSAFIAGLDCGDYTVANGSIVVPFGDSVSGGTANGLFTVDLVQSFTVLPAVVGFTYNSDGQLLRPVTPADSGAQAGPGFAKLGRQHRVAAQLYGIVNGSISFGTDFVTMYPAKLRFANDVPYPINQLWSGIYRDNVNSIIDFDGMISWRISRPLPAFVIAVGGFDTRADA